MSDAMEEQAQVLESSPSATQSQVHILVVLSVPFAGLHLLDMISWIHSALEVAHLKITFPFNTYFDIPLQTVIQCTQSYSMQ